MSTVQITTIVILLVAIGGGAWYAYTLHTKNETPKPAVLKIGDEEIDLNDDGTVAKSKTPKSATDEGTSSDTPNQGQPADNNDAGDSSPEGSGDNSTPSSGETKPETESMETTPEPNSGDSAMGGSNENSSAPMNSEAWDYKAIAMKVGVSGELYGLRLNNAAGALSGDAPKLELHFADGPNAKIQKVMLTVGEEPASGGETPLKPKNDAMPESIVSPEAVLNAIRAMPNVSGLANLKLQQRDKVSLIAKDGSRTTHDLGSMRPLYVALMEFKDGSASECYWDALTGERFTPNN